MPPAHWSSQSVERMNIQERIGITSPKTLPAVLRQNVRCSKAPTNRRPLAIRLLPYANKPCAKFVVIENVPEYREWKTWSDGDVAVDEGANMN